MTATLPHSPTIVLACACDDAYAMPLGAALASAAHWLHPTARLAIHVLDGGLSPASRQKLVACVPAARGAVSFHDITHSPIAGLDPGMHFTWIALARLLVPDLLPVDRALWLDSDTIVCADLLDLWRTELGDAPIGAVRESTIGAHIPFARDLGLDPAGPYCNAGVFVMDVAALRRADFTRRALAFIHAHGARLKYWDQDAINALTTHVPIDPRWNHIPAHDPADMSAIAAARGRAHPHIVHFASVPKPWHWGYGYMRPYGEYFFHALALTPWRGWQPPVRLRQVLRASAPKLYEQLRRWRG